ncbi:uncharacterized protein CDAR_165951 [Caerostris darwini]|uniref:Uncharacterized protein n=1 Tax=Caerostris darwini TaxID=1538125 RepID=A0AAV4RUX3_9ARAC|nr:uncharacterized protein CDAR_165951 [Caerostris darwini]
MSETPSPSHVCNVLRKIRMCVKENVPEMVNGKQSTLRMMKPILKLTLVWLLAVISFEWTMSAILAQEEKSMMPFEDSPDDGTVKNALMYYLLSRQVFNGIQSRQPIELQRKRATYSKQCSFNAVSCFGKK